MDMLVTRRLAHRFGISLNGDGETFKVLAFKAEERLSETFRLQVELSSRKADVDIDTLLEKDALLTIQDEGPTGGEPRYFHGKITAFRQVSIEAEDNSGHAFYSVTVEPDLALLKWPMNCRLYQQKTTKEIASELLQEGGVRKVKWLVTRALQPRELCCQWQETNFQFFQRLMGECGIWYYFTHTKDGHELVLTDRVEGAGALKPESIEYNGTPGGSADKAFVYRYAYQKEIGAGKAMQREYSFRNPRHNYQSYASSGARDAARELYFYPGRYKRDEVGKDFTRMWLESHRALLERGEGASNIHQLVPGHTASLTGYRDPYNRKYLVVSVLHEGTQPQSAEEDAGEQEMTSYNNSFVVIPDTIPFRPPQHQKPVVDGPMMAVVVGPEGEEFHIDSYGRVKCYFNWDREDKKDDSSSCWIRVAQGWAGPLYGAFAHPRIGHEVLVSFLDGDIDQMFVSGRAYHDANKYPYTLPTHKTQTGIKTKTHKGDGYNLLRFEDEKGSEQIAVRAEKDMDIIVQNDRKEWVQHDRHLLVDGKRVEEIKGAATSIVAKDRFFGTGQKLTVTAGDDLSVSSSQKYSVQAGDSVYIKAGAALVLEAPEITIKAPGGFIRVDGGGITILGNAVNVNSGGSPGTGVVASSTSALQVEKADERN